MLNKGDFGRVFDFWGTPNLELKKKCICRLNTHKTNLHAKFNRNWTEVKDSKMGN